MAETVLQQDIPAIRERVRTPEKSIVQEIGDIHQLLHSPGSDEDVIRTACIQLTKRWRPKAFAAAIIRDPPVIRLTHELHVRVGTRTDTVQAQVDAHPGKIKVTRPTKEERRIAKLPIKEPPLGAWIDFLPVDEPYGPFWKAVKVLQGYLRLSTREDEFPPDGSLRHEWETAIEEVCHHMDIYSGRTKNLRRRNAGYTMAFKKSWIDQNRMRKNAENKVVAAIGALVTKKLNRPMYDFGKDNERLVTLHNSLLAFNQTERGRVVPRGTMRPEQLQERVTFMTEAAKNTLQLLANASY